MDLRIERTKKCIKDAFIELRKKKSIEKISVKELAALACINKATFYSHYHDIYDLTEQLENEIIASTIQSIPHLNNIITNPFLAVEELTIASIQNKHLTDILFSDNRKGLYSIKMEKEIKKQIFKQYPDFEDNFQWNMILTFLIQGGMQSYSSYYTICEKEARSILCELNQCIKKHFLDIENISS